MLTDRQIDRICDVYEEYGTITMTEEITGFNYRTIRKYLTERQIETQFKVAKTPVRIIIDSKEMEFDSISSASRHLAERDKKIHRELLSSVETFEEGMEYTSLTAGSYRRYINAAIEGTLIRKFDWEVLV